MKTIRYLVGLLLILIGGFSLITYIFHLNNELIHHLWFLCVLIPGLYFEMNYFQTRKNPGQLVPGGILTVIGLLFCFEILTRWDYSNYTWPIYLLAVAFGLLQLYLYDHKDKGLLIPITILCFISLLFYVQLFISSSLLLAICLIIIGLYILFQKRYHISVQSRIESN